MRRSKNDMQRYTLEECKILTENTVSRIIRASLIKGRTRAALAAKRKQLLDELKGSTTLKHSIKRPRYHNTSESGKYTKLSAININGTLVKFDSSVKSIKIVGGIIYITT